ncbi:Fc.00g072280.m01.CDS01 [Cosmosporella sp. VM-42]
MAPEQSTQTDAPSPITTPSNTQPPHQAVRDYQQQQQQQQQQGQFQFQPYQQYAQSYGQPFQPYQPPPQQQYTQQQQQPVEVPTNKVWEWTKLGLHIASIVLCTCGLAITFSLIGHGGVGRVALACCPVLILALIWSIAELITRCVRKFKAGIHPGAHVALSLLIWLSLGTTGGIEATLVAVTGDRDYGSNCWDYDTQDYVDCEPAFSGKRPQFVAVTVFTCLVFLVHFILFVGACIDTAKRNAAARRPIMVVAAPQNWGQMAQGWQPMPQYGGPQGQYMSVPQQNIPLQTRSPSPGVEQEGKGKEVEQTPTHGVREFYTPGSAV